MANVETAIALIRGALETLSAEERREVIARVTPPPPTVADALARTHGNITEAAQLLRCSRHSIQAEMRRLGIPQGKAGRRRRLG